MRERVILGTLDALTAEELASAAGLDGARAEALRAAIVGAWQARGGDWLEAWRRVTTVLDAELPFAVHRLVHERAFAGWSEREDGPPPVWVPGRAELTESNAAKLVRLFGVASFAELHALSVREPERYWPALLERLGICADTPPVRSVELRDGAEKARWFPGMRLNIAACALERRGSSSDDARPAVVFRREGGPLEVRTLAELCEDSRKVAASLVALGLAEGDAIAIDMPMTYASVAIYLGVVRMGGAVVAIADSFSAQEIATRLRIGEAKLVFTQDVIVRGDKTLPLYERVREAGPPRTVVLAAREVLSAPLAEGDLAWPEFLARGAGTAAPYAVRDVEAETNVLFSSGTTGEPKAIPWSQLTPIKAAADAHVHHDVRPGDVVCWPTNLGWMMGPWLIYASLLNDATLALYEGSPLGRDFGAFVADARVSLLGLVPSLVKTWRASDCMRGLDWSALRAFSSTGEASTPLDMHWLMTLAGYRPIIEYCGGTEIGGGYLTGSVLEPQVPSAFSTPAMGASFVLLDEHGAAAGTGELALVAPMCGSSNRLKNRDHHEVYFAGMPKGAGGETLRRHGDEVERLGGGYYRALGRVDDTMNLGGIKTSSAELERVCNRAAGVLETAAIATTPRGGGPSQLVLYCVLAPGASVEPAELARQLSQAIARDLNPLFKIHEVVTTAALPRTASNKVMRRVLRAEYEAARRG